MMTRGEDFMMREREEVMNKGGVEMSMKAGEEATAVMVEIEISVTVEIGILMRTGQVDIMMMKEVTRGGLAMIDKMKEKR